MPVTAQPTDRKHDRTAAGAGSSDWFHQLDPVAERVIDVAPVESVEGLIPVHLGSTCSQQLLEGRQVLDKQRRVRFACWPEVGLDPEVQRHISVREPAPAPNLKMRRLRNPRQSEQPLVELDRGLFASRGHGELDVVDPVDPHAHHSASCSRSRTGAPTSSEPGPSVGVAYVGRPSTARTAASCSHPVADAVVFSKLFASRRDQPRFPCATSTRQA